MASWHQRGLRQLMIFVSILDKDDSSFARRAKSCRRPPRLSFDFLFILRAMQRKSITFENDIFVFAVSDFRCGVPGITILVRRRCKWRSRRTRVLFFPRRWRENRANPSDISRKRDGFSFVSHFSSSAFSTRRLLRDRIRNESQDPFTLVVFLLALALILVRATAYYLPTTIYRST